MKKRLLILAIPVLLVLLCVQALPTTAYADTQELVITVTNPAASTNGLKFTIADGKATIIGCTATGTVSIPETIDGYPVTTIASYAFKGSNVTTVYIPKSVTSMSYAFSGCTSLVTAYFGQGITEIPAHALEGSSVQKVYLPDSVTIIREAAFKSCASLKETIGAPETTTIKLQYTVANGTATIVGCTASGAVSIPASINGNAVTAIGANAFSGSSATSVSVPDSVTTIGSGAFKSTQTIYCNKDTAAYQYAVANNIPYQLINPVITVQPKDVVVAADATTATFTLTAENVKTYQWEWASVPAEGQDWTWKSTSATGNKTNTLTVNATASNAKLYFRCVLTSNSGRVIYSDKVHFVFPADAVITAQPEDVVGVTTSTVTFSLTAENAKAYQWQWAAVPAEGQDWTWKSTGATGNKTDTLTVNATASNAKLYFRCAVTGTNDNVTYSEQVHFVLPTDATITVQPADVLATGTTATFSLTAENAKAYQWQWAAVPAEGQDWTWKATGATGNKTDTLTVNASASNAKLYFRCAVTGTNGKVTYSEKVHFTLPADATITVQPVDVLATGTTATFTLTAENAKAYQWQWAAVPAEGQDWTWKATGATGNKTDTLTVNASASNAKLYFRCAVTGTNDKVTYSEKVHFTLPADATITVQPVDVLATGNTATFTLTAENAKAYQWQWAAVPADGQSWTWKATSATGNKTNTLTVNATDSNAKLYFRCAVTGTSGKVTYSEKVHFTQGKDATITVQPVDVVATGNTATFTLTAEDAASYQWQWASVPADGQSWTWKATSATGNKTNTLTVNATDSNAKLYFRCAVTGTSGKVTYSEKVHFTQGKDATITVQPVDVVATGNTATFTLTAENAASYQWQWASVPADGQSWTWKATSATGNKTATLTVNATDSNAKLYFRCAVTGTSGKVTYSEKVHFTQGKDATITVQPVDVVTTGNTATFTLTAENAASYQWQWASVPADGQSWTWKATSATGNKTDTLTVNATDSNAKLYFRCAVTGTSGKVTYSEKAHFTRGADATITTQPSNVLNVTANTVSFSVTAQNAASYQWQWASVPADGQSWTWKATSATGNKTATLTVNATDSNEKLYFRCAVTGTSGKVTYSEKAHFTKARAAVITVEPQDVLNVPANAETVTFTVTAKNVKSYQWQWAAVPAEGQEWVWKSTSAAGNKTSTFTPNATASNAKLYFRCAITGTDGSVTYTQKVHFTFAPVN